MPAFTTYGEEQHPNLEAAAPRQLRCKLLNPIIITVASKQPEVLHRIF